MSNSAFPNGSQPQQPGPQSPTTPPQYGQTPPQYGQTPPQYGQTPPQYGQTPPQYGQIPPQYQTSMPPQAGYSAPPAPAKSGLLGLIGLGLVLVSGVGLSALAWVVGGALGDFMVQIGANTIDINDPTLQNDPRFIAFGQQVAGQVALIQGAVGLGFVGWIVSIVAVVVKRGRSMGIIGIILGVLFPLIAIGALFAGMMPAISSMTN